MFSHFPGKWKVYKLCQPLKFKGFKAMKERIHKIMAFYAVGDKPDSLVITIPAEVRSLLGLKPGQKVFVKTDAKGRIILELVE